MTQSTETTPPTLARGELKDWTGGYKPMVYAEALASVLETALQSDYAEELTDNQHKFLFELLDQCRQLERALEKSRH